MSEILDAVNGEGPYAKDKGEISTTAPHGNTLDSDVSHAPLECPECGNVCKPTREWKDGSATYYCRRRTRHSDFRDLRFIIDGDGELHF